MTPENPAEHARAGWWQSRSLRGKTLVAVALPVLALLIAMTGILVERQDTKVAVQQSATALQSQVTLQRLLTLVTTADTSLRAYLVTHDRQLLDQHDDAVARLPATVRTLGRQVAGDVVQMDRLEQLESHLATKIRTLEALEGASVQGRQRARALRKSGRHLREISTIAGSMDRHAQEEYLGHSASARRANARSTAVTLSAVGLALLGGLTALLMLSNGLIRRLELVRDNAQRLAGGMPLLPMPHGHDELAQVARTLEETSLILADKESLLELTIEAGGLILFETDPDGEIRLRGEPTLVASLGLETEPHRTTLARVREALVEGGHPGGEASMQGDIRIATVDGGVCRLDVRARHVYDASGQPTGVLVGVATDVTTRAVALEALEAAKEKAELANRTKDEFLSRVSHELRTPLNAILGFAQLLEMDRLSVGQTESVKHILDGGHHLLALVNDMLDLARIESGWLSLSIEVTCLYDVVSDAVHLMQPIARSHDVTVELGSDCAPDVCVLADRQRTRQIVLNLLSNAVKYNKPGGAVVIDFAPEPDELVRLRVTDTGSGIEESYLPALFTPFNRLGAQQTVVEGTGLGLSLSRRLAEAMGGHLDLESTGRDGSVFTVLLPLAPADAVVAPAQADESVMPDLTGVRVLHIEDNAINLVLVDELLSRAGAPKPMTAKRGNDGFDQACEVPPDLVLLDQHLPDMRGEDVLVALKSHPLTEHIPVVILSADALTGASRMQELGAVSTVAKPIEIASFWQAISAALAATSPERTRGGRA